MKGPRITLGRLKERVSGLVFKWQLDLAEVLAGFNQNQWAFVQHNWRFALTRHVHRLGLCRDGLLNSADLLGIRVHPLQTDLLGQSVQLGHRQLKGLHHSRHGLGGCCRRGCQ